VPKSLDLAHVYYWEIELIEPDDPDDPRYVILHGEDGEIVGPFTVAMAQAWIDRFTLRNPAKHDQPPSP
jgi:hypothetical protein